MEEWIPKTDLGRQVKSRKITDINEILDNGFIILEPQITDTLLPDMQNDLLLIGQSKGKFGGGRRRVFRQTQKKTREGNKPKFAAYSVVGNGDGIVGLGYGKARETVPARDKALRAAKLNVFKIARGSGSWESRVKEPHTVPFTVEGSCGSVRIKLMPAPKGKGLVAEKEVAKILQAAGISDVWMQSFGQTKNKINLIKAVEQALRKLVTTKLRPKDIENLAVHYGNVKPIAIKADFEEMSKEQPVPKSTKQVTSKDAPKKEDVSQKTPPQVVESKPSSDTRKQTSESSLSDISGIGESTQQVLIAAGITNAQKLASADEKTLKELEGIGPASAKKFIAAAKKHMGEKK